MPFKIHLRLSQAMLFGVVAGLVFYNFSFAQVRPASRPAEPRGGLNPDSFYGKETFQGVSVRDSLEAVKKIEDARRMERLKDWNKAADWYQEVIEKYGQYVVPSGTDEQNNIRQYTGIERPVQEQLAKWPKEGLDAYKNRYGAVAGTMLEQARQDDRETLSRVMKLYFVTEAGKQAGIRLMDLLLEGGEFAEAARLGDRLLDWHPALVVERPKVLFRTALAYHLCGDEKKANERGDQLKAKHAGAIGMLFGKDIVLSEALDKLLQVTPPISVATANSALRMNPGGDETRSMISASMGRPDARLATIDYVPLPPYNNNNMNARRAGMVVQDDGGGDQSAGFGVMPVADGGDLYFQDGSRIYAVSLQSGVPLPGWLQTYPTSNGQYAISSYGNPRAVQHTVTLTDNSLLAVMGYSDKLAMYGQPAFGSDKGTRLVCLDRTTGREKWATKSSKITEENLRVLDLSGSPLVVGDNVYVIGRGGKNITSEDCYVLCFDINTGSYKWSCFIASSNNGFNQFTGQYGNTDTLSHLAYSSGRIYILTNIGAAAAIDAYSGTISWLNIYPRDVESVNPNMGFRGGYPMRNSSTKAWEFNPVIVQDGKVFVMPTDSKFIMIYDAGTGAEVKRIETAELRDQSSGADSASPEALLAVDGKQLIMSGGMTVFCIDWTEPLKSSVVWRKNFATPIIGRGFVTSDSVFVCTQSVEANHKYGYGQLSRIERYIAQTGAPSGRVRQNYPAGAKDWDEGEGPGNVIVTGDHVLVAGSKRLNVYTDMKLARKRLDDAVAAAPNDPEPYLRYAEVMFVAGKLDVAMEKVKLSVEKLGGLKSLRPGPEREHLFSDCLTFAAKRQKQILAKTLSSDEIQPAIDEIAPFYDLAAAAAEGDSQQVNYRMSRAKFNRDFKDDNSLEAAIDLYQEILGSQRLRVVGLADETQTLMQAGDIAEKMIKEVRKLKPNSYDKYEKLASEALQAAGADPALLKTVAETYPNAAAAPQAITKAAAAFEAQDNVEGHRLATLTLQKVYAKYGETADKFQILEAMARNYLAMPETSISDRAGTASARLASMIKLGGAERKLSKPLVLADKKVLANEGETINEALKAVQKYKTQTVSAKLPDFHIAPMAAYHKAIAAWQEAGEDPDKQPKQPDPFIITTGSDLSDVTALLKPPLELRQQCSRYDRIVVSSNGAVQIYPIGSKTPAGVSPEFADAKNLAWIDNNTSLLVWSDGEIALLDGATAAQKWKKTIKALPKIEVVAAGNVDENMSGSGENGQINNMGGRPIFRGGINRVGGMAVPVQGAVPAAPNAETISSVRPVDDKIILATNSGQIFALNVKNGDIAWHLRLSATAAISRVAATDDFTIAKVDDQTATQLVVINTYDGTLIKRMNFPNETGVPVNFALAPDGMLVWILPDRLCGKDLFEPKAGMKYDIPASPDARNPNMNGQGYSPIYAGAANPDQLLISEGRIIVVNNAGKFISVHSVETGQMTARQPDGRTVDMRLPTTGGDGSTPVNDWGVGMHLLGSKLYVCTRQNAPVCYNVDKTKPLWNGTLSKPTTPSLQFQEPYIGQDYFVVFDRPAASSKPGAPALTNSIRIHCYTRAAFDETGRESGRVDYTPLFRDDSGITDFQGVEGGFYYLSGDKRLHFLKGARTE